MVRREDKPPACPWETSMQRNQLSNPLHHACNQSHNSHHSHDGRKPHCSSRSQQQLPCSHINKNLNFNRNWGCCDKHKSLSLVLVITKPPRSRNWKYHSTQSRCKGVGWRDPSRARHSRRLWVKQVMLSAHTAGLRWVPFAVKSRKKCLQLADLLSYNEACLYQGLKPSCLGFHRTDFCSQGHGGDGCRLSKDMALGTSIPPVPL